MQYGPPILSKHNSESKTCIGNNDDNVITNIGSVMSAGYGEVDDVLVGGGQQGDEEEAEDEQDPPKAGIRPVAHFGNKFTSTAWACHPGKAMTRLMF